MGYENVVSRRATNNNKLKPRPQKNMDNFTEKTKKEAKQEKNKSLYQTNPTMNSEFFVYMVDGEKRFYDFYRDLNTDFKGHTNVIYLGIGSPLDTFYEKHKDWPNCYQAKKGQRLIYLSGGKRIYFKTSKSKDYFEQVLKAKDVVFIGETNYVHGENNFEIKIKQSCITNLKCVYCETALISGSNTLSNSKTKDHVIPRHKGGRVVRWCCLACNQEKGGLMLHSYIQLLNLKIGDAKGSDIDLLQIKIKNANKLAIEINK